MIEIKDVSKSYRDKLILRNINLVFESGQFIVIIGSSGCGKTTLLKLINKLLPMDKGDILIDGVSIKSIPDTKLRRKIGYVMLNKDNEDYETYRALAEKFMAADKQGREEIFQKAPDGMWETLRVLKNARVRMVIDQEIFRALNNRVNDKDRRIVSEIIDESISPIDAAFTAFRYGVMCGKRAERAKKKKE